MELKTERTAVSYAIAVWMAINIILMILMIATGDVADLNKWIEIVLWTASIAGVLSMRKWGAAFATFTLCYTLSTSVGIIIYYQIWLNALRVLINLPLIVYFFKRVFAGKFK